MDKGKDISVNTIRMAINLEKKWLTKSDLYKRENYQVLDEYFYFYLGINCIPSPTNHEKLLACYHKGIMASTKGVIYFSMYLPFNYYIIAFLPKRPTGLLYKSNLPNWSFTETSGIHQKCTDKLTNM